jgi:hypothetical protein
MTKQHDVEFESVLRSLVLSPEETLRRDALREKSHTQVASVFAPLSPESHPFEIPATQKL